MGISVCALHQHMSKFPVHYIITERVSMHYISSSISARALHQFNVGNKLPVSVHYIHMCTTSMHYVSTDSLIHHYRV